jgi:ATP-dependent Clp protease ATP-binding subunit ClpB
MRQLDIERVALSGETDEASARRRATLEEEYAELKEESDELAARWQAEKHVITKIQSAKQEYEDRKSEAERLERQGDLNGAAALRYGTLPELEGTIDRATKELEVLQQNGAFLKEEVDAEDIAEVVSRWTGVPVAKLLEGEADKLIHMERLLHSRVVGQDGAVTAVANAIRRSRAGLSDPHRPIGSFLFLGPTGVGKTELARALAEYLFDDERAMVRLDMSEYMEKFAVSRLIGAPPGYVGYEEGGQLTEAIRRRPYAVVLLDEIEKAHPDVYNLLLQVLDDGRLTDGQGRTVDFTNVVFIMTSNLAGDPQEFFRPEFINRVDDIIRFRSLDEKDLAVIVGIQLGRLRERLAERELSLEVSANAASALATEGFDPDFGARPLKRVIQRRLEDPLALAVLEGVFKAGDTINVDAVDGVLTFH